MHALLAVMRERGVTAVTMEVSSHALRLGRVDGVRFDVAGFTNLSPDHLDFHADMDDYFAAKAELFTARARASVRSCASTTRGPSGSWPGPLPRGCRSRRTPVSGSRPTGRRRGVVTVPGGSVLRGLGPGGIDVPLEVRLPGEFNVANALGALAPADRRRGRPARGRRRHRRVRRRAGPDGARGRPRSRREGCSRSSTTRTRPTRSSAPSPRRERAARGSVVVVLGAGGDRDPHKRPAMGEAAARGRRPRGRDRRQPALGGPRRRSGRRCCTGCATSAASASRRSATGVRRSRARSRVAQRGRRGSRARQGPRAGPGGRGYGHAVRRPAGARRGAGGPARRRGGPAVIALTPGARSLPLSGAGSPVAPTPVPW